MATVIVLYRQTTDGCLIRHCCCGGERMMIIAMVPSSVFVEGLKCCVGAQVCVSLRVCLCLCVCLCECVHCDSKSYLLIAVAD